MGWEDNKRSNAVARYLASTLMDTMANTFKEASLVMDWLTEAARRVAAMNEHVTWTSPVGLPCFQPYTHVKDKSVRTLLQGIQVARAQPSYEVRVEKKQQR